MGKLLFSFSGRIGRKTYWLYFLAYAGVMTVAQQIMRSHWLLALIIAPVLLSTFWTTSAVLAKRWHDRDKSGWWTFICLIPAIGPMWLILECGFLKGSEGANKYGPDPLD